MTWSCGWSANPRKINSVTDELFQDLAMDKFLMDHKDTDRPGMITIIHITNGINK
jgi:hypothetical protein